ncbi:MAG: DUF6442 family protein, partial [Clostridia bacterium]|nr:DUF6442 family protein [Clostridia bacterium]
MFLLIVFQILDLIKGENMLLSSVAMIIAFSEMGVSNCYCYTKTKRKVYMVITVCSAIAVVCRIITFIMEYAAL